MPIEDVDYLLQNSEQDSFIVNADSSLRDKRVHPTPSEFTLDFENHFSYVYGISILDVSFPSSMYNIENFNNAFKFHIMWLNKEYENTYNHDIFYDKILPEIKSYPIINNVFEQNKNSHIVFVDQFNENNDDVENILEGSVNDNILAIRKVINNIPFKSTTTLNDKDIEYNTCFRIRNKLYYIPNEYHDIIDVLTRDSVTSFDSLRDSRYPIKTSLTSTQRFYDFTFQNNSYSIPIIREKNISFDVYTYEYGLLYDFSSNNESELQLKKLTKKRAKEAIQLHENIYFVSKDKLYKYDIKSQIEQISLEDNKKIEKNIFNDLENNSNVLTLLLTKNTQSNSFMFKGYYDDFNQNIEFDIDPNFLILHTFPPYFKDKIQIEKNSINYSLTLPAFTLSSFQNTNIINSVDLPKLKVDKVKIIEFNNILIYWDLQLFKIINKNDENVSNIETEFELHYLQNLEKEILQSHSIPILTMFSITQINDIFYLFKTTNMDENDNTIFIPFEYKTNQTINKPLVHLPEKDIHKYENDDGEMSLKAGILLPLTKIKANNSIHFDASGRRKRIYELNSNIFIWDDEKLKVTGKNDILNEIKTYFDTQKSNIYELEVDDIAKISDNSYACFFKWRDTSFNIISSEILEHVTIYKYDEIENFWNFGNKHRNEVNENDMYMYLTLPFRKLNTKNENIISDQFYIFDHDLYFFDRIDFHGNFDENVIYEDLNEKNRERQEGREGREEKRKNHSLDQIFDIRNSLVRTFLFPILQKENKEKLEGTLVKEFKNVKEVGANVSFLYFEYSWEKSKDDIFLFQVPLCVEIPYYHKHLEKENITVENDIENEEIKFVQQNIRLSLEQLTQEKEGKENMKRLSYRNLWLFNKDNNFLISQNDISSFTLQFFNVIQEMEIKGKHEDPILLESVCIPLEDFDQNNENDQMKKYVLNFPYPDLMGNKVFYLDVYVDIFIASKLRMQTKVVNNGEDHLFYYVKNIVLSTLITYGYRYFSNVEYVNLFQKYSTNEVDVSNLFWCPLVIFNGFFRLEAGNYNIFQFMTNMNELINASVSDKGSTFSLAYPFTNDRSIVVRKNNDVGEVSKTGRIQFYLLEKDSFFMINLKQSTIKDVLGFSVTKSIVEKNGFQNISNKYIEEDTLIGSIYNGDRNVIIPPGVISLLGTRYVILRCPEIETLIGSNSYGRYSSGIGMFILGVNQQTIRQRLDFVHFVRKPFHPIEKLKRLTFRFELSDGSLFDFKGVDMFMVVQIKTYVPQKKKAFDFKKSQLNPNYNPDFIQYNIDEDEKKAKQEKLLEYEDNSDEEENDVVRIQNEFGDFDETDDSSSDYN